MVCLKKYRNLIYKFRIYLGDDKEIEIKSHITVVKHVNRHGTTLKIMNVSNEMHKIMENKFKRKKNNTDLAV